MDESGRSRDYAGLQQDLAGERGDRQLSGCHAHARAAA